MFKLLVMVVLPLLACKISSQRTMFKFLVMAVLPLLAYSIFGEKKEIDKNDPDVKEALKNGMRIYNAIVNYGLYLKAVDVEKVYVEGAQGRLYSFINLTLQDTNCPKMGFNHRHCEVNPYGQKMKCFFEVWARVWLDRPNKYKLTDSACQLLRKN